MVIAAHTGFRNDEILHLQWRDICWTSNSVHVTTKEGVWSSKNYQEHTVFLPTAVLDWLRAYRAASKFNEDRDWIFSTKNRTPMTTFNVCRSVRKVFQRAGLYRKGVPTLHLLRHTVAATLLNNGTDLETVREWLGHADISTTSIYLHTTDARKRAAVEALPRVL